MYKSLFVILTVIISVFSQNLSAEDKMTSQINPMVLIELGAEMKADWVFSGIMLTDAIKNDLINNQKLSRINHDFLTTEMAKLITAFKASDPSVGKLKFRISAD